MPTYINNTDDYIAVHNIADELISVAPGKVFKSYHIYSQYTVIDPAPYWNPFVHTQFLTSANEGDETTVTLDANTSELEIWNDSSVTVDAYLQSKDNLPAIKILPKTIRTFQSFKGKVTQIIFVFGGEVSANEFCITEFEE